MLNGYLWLKFIHVTAAIFWVGGAAVIAIESWRRARSPVGIGGRAELPGESLMRVMIMPGMIATLLAGFGLVYLRGGMPPWTSWGVLVAIATLVVGLAFVRRYARELKRIADQPREIVLRRRIGFLWALNLLLLLSAVWAMVYKPAF